MADPVQHTYQLTRLTDQSRLLTSDVKLILDLASNMDPDEIKEWEVFTRTDQRQEDLFSFVIRNDKSASNPEDTLIVLEKRNHARHEIQVQVTVMTGSRSFTTWSENLSQGGLLLQRAIPATMRADSARIFLVTANKDKVVEVKGRIAGDVQNQKRIAFVDLEDKAEEEISGWIKTLGPEHRSKKKAA